MTSTEKMTLASAQAIRASVEKNIDKAKAGSYHVLNPLPISGMIAAQEAQKAMGVVMPSEEEMEQEAMALTKSHMKTLASRNLRPEQVVRDIERTLLGVTLRITTSLQYSSTESPASPGIQIFGTQRNINATIKVLPLAGMTIEPTFEVKSFHPVGIGELKYVILTHDPHIRTPWLVHNISVRVGYGKKFVDLLPQASLRGEFWLDGSHSEGSTWQSFHGLPVQGSWLLAPAGLLAEDFHKGNIPLTGYHLDAKLLKGQGINGTKICGNKQHVGDHELGKLTMDCTRWVICDGTQDVLNTTIMEWYKVPNCGITSPEDCADHAFNTRECAGDYIEFVDNGPEHTHCFCNPEPLLHKWIPDESREEIDAVAYHMLKGTLEQTHNLEKQQQKLGDEAEKHMPAQIKFQKLFTGKEPCSWPCLWLWLIMMGIPGHACMMYT